MVLIIGKQRGHGVGEELKQWLDYSTQLLQAPILLHARQIQREIPAEKSKAFPDKKDNYPVPAEWQMEMDKRSPSPIEPDCRLSAGIDQAPSLSPLSPRKW